MSHHGNLAALPTELPPQSIHVSFACHSRFYTSFERAHVYSFTSMAHGSGLHHGEEPPHEGEASPLFKVSDWLKRYGDPSRRTLEGFFPFKEGQLVVLRGNPSFCSSTEIGPVSEAPTLQIGRVPDEFCVFKGEIKDEVEFERDRVYKIERIIDQKPSNEADYRYKHLFDLNSLGIVLPLLLPHLRIEGHRYLQHPGLFQTAMSGESMHDDFVLYQE